MTLTTTFVVSSFGPGVRYTLVPDLEIYVDQAVIVTSTDDDAIRGADGRSSVVVAGRVTGHVAAVQLGDDLSIDALNLVTVEDNGRVHGGTLGIALLSSQSSLRDGGVITANFGAVTFGGDGETTSAVLNNGVISGRLLAVGVNANASETVSLANFGQIIATSEDGYAYLGGSGVDGVANGGHMQGDIELAEGNDTYDGRTGTVTDGVVSGGDGNDLVRPGDGPETFDGDDGIDTLDFLGSSGLRVSLTDASGTGRAQGDTYSSFERVLGSRTGGDTILGDEEANQLVGFGGRDTLAGAQGADRLTGGADQDRLTGGQGNDSFEFLRRKDGGDIITDFRNLSGNNDRFLIDASSFGAGLVAGERVTGTQFDAQANNKAKTDTVRFIFETDVEKLWFDRNGDDPGGLSLIADLQDKAVVTSGDILLV